MQAPQRRTDRREPRQPRRRIEIGRSYWASGLGGAAIVAVVLGLYFGLARSGGADAKTAARAAVAAGCTFQSVPATRSALHITDFKTTVTYNSYPPTSGKHYYSPAIWGDYSQPVDPRQAVHNEEHGGIVIWYGPGLSAAARQKISAFYDASPNAMLVTPLPAKTPGAKFPSHRPLGARIALSAWVGTTAGGHGYVAICPRFDEKAFKAFRDTFRGKGPERYPTSALQPGA